MRMFIFGLLLQLLFIGLMRLSLAFIFCFSLIAACSNGNSDSVVNSAEDSTVCDCLELVFDQPYNNFYLTEPRDGYTGSCENYYPNGNLSLSKNFKKGKVHGDVITYYENGQIKDSKTFDMNFQVGDHFLYAENGDLTFHWKYERGKLVETVFPK